MVIGRIPGLVGGSDGFGCVYVRGTLGVDGEEEWEFPHFTPGVMGIGGDLSQRAAVKPDLSEAEEELKLLVKAYGAVKNKSGNMAYMIVKKKKAEYRTAEYVADRDAFFGSRADYVTCLAKCHEELDADAAKLRKFIEPNTAVRKKLTDWAKAQDVFYAWTRKAYENLLGADIDVPKLIKSGMSDKLKEALAKVKHDYGKDFKSGGFNPRPMKEEGYRLGTVSEHGIGTAVDIEDQDNPHILVPTWKAILAFTGKTVDHSATAWKKSPKAMHTAIQDLSDSFASTLKQALADAEAAKKKAEPATTATPLALAMAADPNLKAVGAEFANQWRDGFFTLPWELVKELHEAGFLWGATFSHPDLHHFEL